MPSDIAKLPWHSFVCLNERTATMCKAIPIPTENMIIKEFIKNKIKITYRISFYI